MKILKKIDIYGVSIPLHVNKEEEFRTVLGGVSTVLTAVLLGFGAYLFGSDFFFSTNPRIVTQTKVPSISEMTYPSSTNHTILWNYERSDGSKIPLEEAKVFPFCYYYDYLREGSSWKALVKVEIPPIECTSTRATENPLLFALDLTKYYCVDWDFIAAEGEKQTGKPYRPRLGGFWDEPELAYFGCKFNSHKREDGKYIRTASNEEIADWVGKNSLFFNFLYPSFYFDTDSVANPFVSFYETYYYELNVKMKRVDRFLFQLAHLKDDQGWIFRDEKEFNASSRIDFETELGVHELDSDQVYTFYKKVYYFNKKQVIFRRSYMKIQDLGAILGGFTKITVLFFKTVVSPFAKHSMLILLAKKLNKNTNLSSFNVRNTSNVSHSKVGIKRENEGKEFNFSFLRYFWTKFILRKKTFTFFEQFRQRLKTEIEVENIMNSLEKNKQRRNIT